MNFHNKVLCSHFSCFSPSVGCLKNNISNWKLVFSTDIIHYFKIDTCLVCSLIFALHANSPSQRKAYLLGVAPISPRHFPRCVHTALTTSSQTNRYISLITCLFRQIVFYRVSAYIYANSFEELWLCVLLLILLDFSLKCTMYFVFLRC